MKIRFRSKTTGKWVKSATWNNYGANVTEWSDAKADAAIFEECIGDHSGIGWLALDPDLRMVRAVARKVVRGTVRSWFGQGVGWDARLSAALPAGAEVEVRLARKGA